MTPEIRYAQIRGVHIAYQVLGKGPIDLVVFLGLLTHAAALWEDPAHERFLRRLASFGRIILFDKRGIGLSDPVPTTPSPILEQWMDDTNAVLDAVGVERAALLGTGTGGQVAMAFAATYPQRTGSLVLANAYARSTRAPDYPWGAPDELRRRLLDQYEKDWGGTDQIALLGPSVADDPRVRDWWSRYQRLAASPGTAIALQRAIFDIDARPVLPLIRVPTLVLHARDSRLIRKEHGRYLAENIAGARYAELAGSDHWIFTDNSDALLDEVEEFLTGVRSVPKQDRVLATVLFTDIVGSTERVAEIGDRRWTDLLAEHDVVIRRQLDRFRGREVDASGDGFFAAFDAPARAIECACAIRDASQRLGLEIRAGLHTGECEVREAGLAGIAVHIGARVVAKAAPGEVLVSSTVKDLVAGSALAFRDRGTYTLKGVPGKWRLFEVQQ